MGLIYTLGGHTALPDAALVKAHTTACPCCWFVKFVALFFWRLQEQRSKLDERMMAAVVSSIKAAEVIIAVVDSGEEQQRQGIFL
jgi:hypothetical protein